ncbi:MAG: ATP-binding cassette domain-containing protein, partial [Planctomycetota bacterium]
MPALREFISDADLAALVAAARREDLGPEGRDATSSLFVDGDERCVAKIVARSAGVVAGLAVLPTVIAAYDPAVELAETAVDGASVEPGDAVLVRGPNGAGKSTLLRALAGFTPVAEGR